MVVVVARDRNESTRGMTTEIVCFGQRESGK